MGAAIALRDDFDGPGLRRLAGAAQDAGQSRRCLALAEIYDGGARSDAAENAIEEIKQDLSHGPTLREVAAKD